MHFDKNRFTKILLSLLVSGFSLITSNSWATKHVITYVSFSYTPSSLTVNVGDTVEWTSGDGSSFADHPLVSVQFPNGAQTISQPPSGSTFDYVVTVAGTYAYWCQFHHATHGMAGAFTASGGAGVSPTPPVSGFELMQNSPNPVSMNSLITFSLFKPSVVSLTVYDAKGVVVANLLSNSAMETGPHTVIFDGMDVPSGAYFYELRANGAVEKKQMIIQH